MIFQKVSPDRGDPAATPDLETESLALLREVGIQGYSTVDSYGTKRPETQQGGKLQDSRWSWLRSRDLISLLEVPVLKDRTMTTIQVTEAGRRHLRQRNIPIVQGEIETLFDQLGHSLKPHYGQALLFAHLARRLGYSTTHGVEVPHRKVMADLLLTRGQEALYVSLESGLERKGHPLDRWHVLAQAQAFLPLVAASEEALEAAFSVAQRQICLIRGTALAVLEARLQRGAGTLWCRRFNRFEQANPQLYNFSLKPDLIAAASCQGLLRGKLRRLNGC